MIWQEMYGNGQQNQEQPITLIAYFLGGGGFNSTAIEVPAAFRGTVTEYKAATNGFRPIIYKQKLVSIVMKIAL